MIEHEQRKRAIEEPLAADSVSMLEEFNYKVIGIKKREGIGTRIDLCKELVEGRLYPRFHMILNFSAERSRNLIESFHLDERVHRASLHANRKNIDKIHGEIEALFSEISKMSDSTARNRLIYSLRSELFFGFVREIEKRGHDLKDRAPGLFVDMRKKKLKSGARRRWADKKDNIYDEE